MNGYSTPSAQQVQEALRRTPTSQLRRAFYEGLVNPLWLEPLRAEGAFDSPPARIRNSDGSTSDPYWPEIEYVVRVASLAPTAAIDILIALTDSDNAWVRRALFAIGSVVPADEAARLKPVLKAWVSSGFGWRSDPREMVNFAINLIRGGQKKTGKWVANALFRPGIREGSRTPELLLEEYWYEAGIESLTAELDGEDLPLVAGWLAEYLKATGETDGWPFSRPDIGERRDSYREVQDSLIDAVRDLAIKQMRVNPADAAFRLLAGQMMLARRIAMFAATKVLVELEPGSGEAPPLVEAAARLLFDEEAKDDRCRREFGELARQVFRHSPTALDPLTQFFADGPPVSEAELRSNLRRDEDESEAEVDARVTEHAERWEHIWLAAVGASALPKALASRLAELDQKYGASDDPLRSPFEVTSWSGPNSPLSVEEFAAMSPEQLISHLESWHDTGDGWGPEPSHEGQARELNTLVAANPNSISGVTSLVARLRPTYLRALMSAWETAFKAELELDWQQVFDAARDVLSHRDELDFPREGGDMDDDPDFHGAKQAAIGLLEELVKKTEPPRVPERFLDQFAQLLLDLVSGANAWEAYSGKEASSGMDPLTLSLNRRWPIYVRSLTALVSHGPSAPWSARARETLLCELDRSDPYGASKSVVGETFSRMLRANPEWTEAQVPTWFGSQTGINFEQQVALSTTMAIHHYHRNLYRLLTPSMLGALALQEPMAEGWEQHNSSPIERIGEWAIKALIFGHIDWDDPILSTFFLTRSPYERGKAMGRIAWEFMRAGEVEDEIRDRFANLWDQRIAHVEAFPEESGELREFFWAARSGKFAAEWWLPRLERALVVDPKLPVERYMIGKALASGATVDARRAFNVTRLLLGNRESQGLALASYDLSRHALPVVLAKALTAGDAELATEATLFMNEIGEAGNLKLAEEVQAAIDGTITYQDVDEE